MNVLAIDPGTTSSAYVIFDGVRVLKKDILPNPEVRDLARFYGKYLDGHLAVEMIASYGMPVGRETFETVLWIGRFIEAWGRPHTLMYRLDIKAHLCHSGKAKDGNVRQALMDRFGGEAARGTKKAPGPLYGVSTHLWAALAVAVTWWDKQEGGGPEETSPITAKSLTNRTGAKPQNQPEK